MTLSPEARLMQANERLRSLEGTCAVLLKERDEAREAVSEAAAVLEHVSYALSGDHYRAALHAAHQCQKFLARSERLKLDTQVRTNGEAALE